MKRFSVIIMVFPSSLFCFSEEKFAADYSHGKRSLRAKVRLNENGIKVAPFEQDFASCRTENIANLDTGQNTKKFIKNISLQMRI